MKTKRQETCPVCKRLLVTSKCRVSLDSVICTSKRMINTPDGKRMLGGVHSYRTIELEPADIVPGPLQHKSIPERLTDIVRWTYEVVGRYLHSTLEKWELVFMRELHIDQEVAIWARISAAYLTYHRKLDIPVGIDEEEERLVCRFVTLTTNEQARKDPENATLLECYMHPDMAEDEDDQ
jgi:hypothetical protein